MLPWTLCYVSALFKATHGAVPHLNSGKAGWRLRPCVSRSRPDVLRPLAVAHVLCTSIIPVTAHTGARGRAGGVRGLWA